MVAELHNLPVGGTVRLERLRRLGIVRTTRAHLALSRRPDFAARMREGLELACVALGRELECPVTASARVVEAAVVPEAVLGSSAAFALVELSAVGAMAALELELPFLVCTLERLAGACDGRPVAAAALTRIEEAAFAFLCLGMLAELRGREGFQLLEPRLSAVCAGRSEALARLEGTRRHMAVELSLEVGGVKGGARLLVPAEALMAALARVPPSPPAELAPEVRAARLWCRAFAGGSQLLPGEARLLAVGDVVLFDDLRLDEGRLLGPVRLSAPGFELWGAATPEGFSAAGARSAFPEESIMSTEPITEDVAGALPVDVEVELTRLRVGLGELAALKPGALLPLRIGVTEPVLLRVGDRAVARAELVEIDGEVGARILALLPEGR